MAHPTSLSGEPVQYLVIHEELTYLWLVSHEGHITHMIKNLYSIFVHYVTERGIKIYMSAYTVTI